MHQIKYADGSTKSVDEFVLKEEIERNRINRPKFVDEDGNYTLLEASEKFSSFCLKDRENRIENAKKGLKRCLTFFTLLLVIIFLTIDDTRFLSLLSFITTLISLNYLGDIKVNQYLSKNIELKSPKNKVFERYIKVEEVLCKPNPLTLNISIIFCILVFVFFILNIEMYSINIFYEALIRLFLHGSALHFIGNLFGLAWVLKRLECLLGKVNTILFLLLSVVLNALVNLYLLPDVIGFSGVILSLIGVLLLVLLEYKSKVHLYDLYFDLFYVVVVGLVGYQFVSNEAHVYGFLIGVTGYWLYRLGENLNCLSTKNLKQKR